MIAPELETETAPEPKVVHIRGEYPIAHPGSPDPTVIAELEDLLEQARAGQIIGLGWAAMFLDESGQSHFCGMASYTTVGHLFAVARRMSQYLDRETG
jgi:hypothetical protein